MSSAADSTLPVTHAELEAELIRIVTTSFALEPARIHPDAKLAEDLGLDSIDMFDILSLLEKRFGCRLNAEDFRSVRTVADLSTRLAEMTVGRAGREV